MTFVPCGALDELNAIYRDRVATALPITAAGGRPFSVTARFEVFSVKKVSQRSNNKAAAALAATLNTTGGVGGGSGGDPLFVPAFDDRSGGSQIAPAMMMQPQDGFDEDEQALLHATTSSWTAGDVGNQQRFSGNGGVDGNNNNANALDGQLSAAPTEHDKLVPLVSAVMDAMYERDGFNFQGVVGTSDVQLLEPAKWLEQVCNVTTKTASSLSALLSGSSSSSSGAGGNGNSSGGAGAAGGKHAGGGAGSSGSGSGGFNLFGGSSTGSAAGTIILTPGGSVVAAAGSSTASSSSSSVAASSVLTDAESRNLWRNISDALNGTSDTMDAAGGASAWPPNAPAASSLVVESGGANNGSGSMKLPSQETGASDTLLGSGASPMRLASNSGTSSSAASAAAAAGGSSPGNSALAAAAAAAATAQPATPLLSVQTPGLYFFRLDAPDLDPLRSDDGSGLRSGLATPQVATPVTFGSAFSAGGGALNRGRGSNSLPFPSTPPSSTYHVSGGGGGGAFNAIRRERSADDLNSIGDSPASAVKAAGGSGGTSFLSEHYFVYFKKTKMLVAVIVTGR